MTSLLLPKMALATTLASVLCANPAAAQAPPRPEAQVPPPAKTAARVEISKGPELELATDHLTIIRWTTNNPGGSDVHYGIVQYGTDPKDLSLTAKNPIRLNRGHQYTTFRVRLEGLKPRTTYYYKVSSEQSQGKSDGVLSSVNKFTTPGPGERIVAGSKRN